MQSLNPIHGTVSGPSRTLSGPDKEPQVEAIDSAPDAAPDRSGSRAQLDPAFRRISHVGSHQSILRRNGSLIRPL